MGQVRVMSIPTCLGTYSRLPATFPRRNIKSRRLRGAFHAVQLSDLVCETKAPFRTLSFRFILTLQYHNLRIHAPATPASLSRDPAKPERGWAASQPPPAGWIKQPPHLHAIGAHHHRVTGPHDQVKMERQRIARWFSQDLGKIMLAVLMNGS